MIRILYTALHTPYPTHRHRLCFSSLRYVLSKKKKHKNFENNMLDWIQSNSISILVTLFLFILPLHLLLTRYRWVIFGKVRNTESHGGSLVADVRRRLFLLFTSLTNHSLTSLTHTHTLTQTHTHIYTGTESSRCGVRLHLSRRTHLTLTCGE